MGRALDLSVGRYGGTVDGYREMKVITSYDTSYAIEASSSTVGRISGKHGVDLATEAAS